jgi:hypothetical protein
MSFIAAGLGIAGLSDAALTVAAGEAIGAGVGALTNPKDRLKGALLGFGTGAAGGALGAGIGALGGEAAGALGSEGVDAADTVANDSAKVMSNIPKTPETMTGGDIANAMGESAPKTPVATTAPTQGSGTMFSGNIGNAVTKAAGPQIMNVAGSAMNPPPSYGNQGAQTVNAAKQQGQADATSAYKSWAHGGSIRLENNSFIIPADVVSAIGNGSTKAGAKYLDHLFAAIAAGPPPKAGSLAKQRAKERQKA